MKAVATRCTTAEVRVAGEVVGQLPAPGLLVLVGVHQEDTAADVDYLVRKLSELRILWEEQSALDLGAPLLVVSQFTLHAATRKGRRPSWNAAAPADQAETMVERVVAGLRERGLHVETGVFGAMMSVSSTNDGPFTILLDSRE